MCGTQAPDRTCVICGTDEVVWVARRHELEFSRCLHCNTEFAVMIAAATPADAYPLSQ